MINDSPYIGRERASRRFESCTKSILRTDDPAGADKRRTDKTYIRQHRGAGSSSRGNSQEVRRTSKPDRSV